MMLSLARWRPPATSALATCFVSLCTFASLCTAASAQESSDAARLDIVPQTGHSKVLDYDVSPGADVAITRGEEGTVRVWVDRLLRRVVRGHAFALGRSGEIVVATTAAGGHDPEQPALLRVWPPGATEPNADIRLDVPVRELVLLDRGGSSEQSVWLLARGAGQLSGVRRDGELAWSVTPPPEAAITTLLFEPTTGVVIARSGDQLLVLDPSTGRRRLTIPCRATAPPPVVSADGGRLAAICGDELKVWSLESGEVIARFELAGAWFSRSLLAMDGTGRFLAVGGTARPALRIFDVETGRRPAMPSSLRSVTGLAFSKDGSRLLVADQTWSLHIWNPSKAEKLVKLLSFTRASQPRFASGDRFVHAIHAGGVTTWEAATGRVVGFLEGAPWAGVADLTFTPDGRTLISHHPKNIRIWNLGNGSTTTVEGRQYALTEDGSHLLVGPNQGKVQVWRLADLRFSGELSATHAISAFTGGGPTGRRAAQPWTAQAPPKAHPVPADEPASQPRRGALAATGSVDGEILVWDVATGQQLHRFEITDRSITSLLLSSATRRLVAVVRHGPVKLYDLDSGETIDTLEPGDLEHRIPRLSPDGRLLAIASRRMPHLLIWHTETGELRRWVDLPVSDVQDLFFLDRRRLLVDLRLEMGLLLVDPNAEDSPIEIVGKTDVTQEHMALSSDGSRFATGNSHGLVETWRFGGALAQPSALPMPEDGDASFRLGGKVSSLAFSPDGRFLAVGQRNGLIRLRDAEQGDRGWLFAAGEKSWAAAGPEGHWDSSGVSARAVAVWRGSKAESLSTLESRHRPGLLAKLLPVGPPPPEAVDPPPARSAPVRPEKATLRSGKVPVSRPSLPSLQVRDSSLLGFTGKLAVETRPDGSALAYVEQRNQIVVFEVDAAGDLHQQVNVPLPPGALWPLEMLAGGGLLYASFKDEVLVLDPSASPPRWHPGPVRQRYNGAFAWWRDHLLVGFQDQLRRFKRRARPADAPSWVRPGGAWVAHEGRWVSKVAVDEDGDSLALISRPGRRPEPGSREDKTPGKSEWRPEPVLAFFDRLVTYPPRLRSELFLDDIPKHLAVDGTLVAATFPEGCDLFDVSDAKAPRRRVRLNSPSPGRVAFRDGRLYVVDQHLGLRVFSLEDPAAPRQIATFGPRTSEASGHGNDLAWAGSGWLLTTSSGLYFLEDVGGAPP